MQAHKKYILMRFFGLAIVVLLSSCEFFKPKEITNQPEIAVVNTGKVLYPSDLEGLFPPNASVDDSIILAEKYVDDWVKKQLMIDEAIEKTQLNEAEIERKVLEYRYALIVHTYVKNYIDKNLDKEVTDDVINQYYQEKSDNFLLKQNIVKCIFAKIPKTAPNVRSFRRNFREYPEVNQEDFKSYMSQYSLKSNLEDTVWIPLNDIIFNTPLEDTPNANQFLETTTFSETSDETHTYFLKIFDYKISEEVSPLQFIRDDIVNIILNKRKIELKKELEEKIYDNAVSQNLFQITRR